MKRLARYAVIAAGLVVLGGCGRDSNKSDAPKAVRPVLSAVVKPAFDLKAGFAGTIQPQFQTDRGFRVLGRITARYVFVGDVVKAGQQLAKIDPLPYELTVRSKEGDLFKAQSQLANSAGAESRSGTLLEKQVVSQAEFDSKQQSRTAAAASVQQAQADLDKAREQLGYTTLTADIDGVITSTDAEVGQIVSAGKKILSLARLDSRDAVVDLPEEIAHSLAVGTPFDIHLQVDTSVKAAGKVREIAPQADATTRTRRVKIALDNIPDAFRLGTTVTVTPLINTDQSAVDVPRSALLERDGATRIWLIDSNAKTVRSVVVKVSADQGPNVRIAEGLSAGERVVIAGVNKLSEGQQVKIDERAAR